MEIMKRAISVILVLMMLAAAILTGCGAKNEPKEPAATPGDTGNAAEQTPANEPAQASDAPVEIRAAWWGDTNRHELYNQILDEFKKKYPNITVVREPQSWNDYWDKLTVQSASGGAPDFMGMHVQFANDYLRRGLIEPLDSYINDGVIDISKMPQGAVATGVVDGVTYMIPMGLTGQSAYINTTMMKELGIDTPDFNWTWDDVKTIGSKVRAALDAAGKKNVWFMDDNATNYQLFRYWVRQNGKGREIYTSDGDLGCTEEEVATWYAYWNDLRSANIIPDAATSVEYAKATLENHLFAQRKIAIRFVPANQYKQYALAMPDAEIALIRNPSKADGVNGEYVEGAHFAVSSKTTSEKKLAAAKLINFWVNDEDSMKLFGMDQGVPANTDMAEFIKPNLDEYQSKVMEYVNKIAELSLGETTYPPAGASEIDALFRSVAEKTMFGASTPEEAAAEFVKGAKEIIETNKAK
jgi:multiple sugar transport system substrate-binding protein